MYLKDTAAAEAFMIALAKQVWKYPGPLQELQGEDVRLDTNMPKDYLPKSYADSLPATLNCYQPMKDGSYIEGIYFAYKKPTVAQMQASKKYGDLGVSLNLVRGSLIAVRPMDYGCQVQHTQDLREGTALQPHLAFRSMAVGKGMLCAIAIDEPKGTVKTNDFNMKDLREQFKARLKTLGIVTP